MNENIKKYLPIGSVIILKGATKRLMITGFCVVAKQNNLMYDYCGCLYPEGIVLSDNRILFNHDQIDKIYFVGLSDIEEKTFKEKLNSLLQEKLGSSYFIKDNINDKTQHLSQPQSNQVNNNIQQFFSNEHSIFNTLNLNQQNDVND